MKKNPVIIAHRAGNQVATANKALKSGANIIELDVHMTRDQILLVQHEPYIKINNRIIYIGKSSHNEIKNYCKELDLNPIVLLSDILEWAYNSETELMLDIKNGPIFYLDVHKIIGKLIYEHQMEKKTWIISFDHKCIYDFKNNKKYPLRAGIIYVARLFDITKTIKLINCDLIETHNNYLTLDLIKDVHKCGKSVCSWSTNEADMINKLNNLCVDMITTDFPEVAINILNQK